MSIEDLTDVDLSKNTSVKSAADFALKDYNQNSGMSPLILKGIDKAAVKMVNTGAGGMIFYLSVRLQDEKETFVDPPPFSTAVLCVAPSMEPSKTVGFLELSWYMMKDDDDDDDEGTGIVDSDFAASYLKELTLVADLALRSNNDKGLQLEDVVDGQKSRSNTTDIYLLNADYHLTLQVGDGSKSSLVRTLATTSRPWGDEFFYSTPLITIAQKPYPDWISVQLLEAVSVVSLEHFRVFHQQNDDTEPILFFKDADCLYQLSRFAQLLGTHKTISELIPFLAQDNDHVDPLVLNLMAREVRHLIPYLGMSSYHLLPPLFSICRLAPHTIEEAAISFELIAAQAKEAQDSPFCAMFVPFVMNLSSSQSVLHRSLSCGLFSIAYQTATAEIKAQLINSYQQLSQDNAPAVRVFFASSLRKFAAATHVDPLSTIIVETIYPSLARDDHEHVRLLAAREFKALVTLFPNNELLYTTMVAFYFDTCLEVRSLAQTLINELYVEAGHELTSAKALVEALTLARNKLDRVAEQNHSLCELLRDRGVAIPPELAIRPQNSKVQS